jgi:hypothetical protein
MVDVPREGHDRFKQGHSDGGESGDGFYLKKDEVELV